MSVWLNDDPLVIERGEGCELIDTDGNRYLDGVSSLWVNIHGHGHPAIDAAIREQLDAVAHSTFLGLTHPPAIELAARLVAIAPGDLTRVFFSENGAAAVEVALKMAYSYWRNQGQERDRFVRLQHAYHGDTIGAVSIGGIERFHDSYRPLLFATAELPAPYCYRCPLGKEYPSCDIACADELEPLLAREGDRVAAVVVEPLVQGAAGMITAPDGHLARVAEIVRRHGVLLVVDEVATGFGRTGRMFASEIDGVEPDIMCLAKGITGGYLPLSATLATEAVFDAFLGAPEEHKTLYHGHSYSANPLCCAAALANLAVFEEERTLEGLEPKIELLRELLEPLRRHPNVGDIRQRGFMVGIELVADKQTKAEFDEALQTGAEVARRARPKGVIVRPLGDVVVLMPPLAMSEQQLNTLVRAVAEAIDEACAAVGSSP
ncbi:MAG: adenosylmethionine--8-amino-7-oxononanoate transaminase [Actinobacteria bacterium]|nr:adenosylmethionine--8-amino-7-oxononanoate transaminase [Actinomycetota bacterium]